MYAILTVGCLSIFPGIIVPLQNGTNTRFVVNSSFSSTSFIGMIERDILTVDRDSGHVYIQTTDNLNQGRKLLFNLFKYGIPECRSMVYCDGKYIVSDYVNDRVLIIDSRSGEVLSTITTGPDLRPIRSPEQIAVDGRNRCFITDTNNHRVIIADLTGKLLGSFGQYGTEQSSFRFPRGVVTIGDFVAVSDSLNDRICIYNQDGTLRSTINVGVTGSDVRRPTFLASNSDGQIWALSELDRNLVCLSLSGDKRTTINLSSSVTSFDGRISSFVSSGNDIYVGETVTGRAFKFDQNGKYRGEVTQGDLIDAKLRSPHQSISLPNGDVWVADSGNHRIAVFNKHGDFIRSIGGFGFAEGLFQYPTAIARRSDGMVAVCDSANHRIQLFSDDGTFLKVLVPYSGTEFLNISFYNVDDDLNFPTDVKFDADGKVIVVDSTNSRLRKYDPETNGVLFSIGSLGAGLGQFAFPETIALSASGDFLIADTQNNRIQLISQNGAVKSSYGSFGAGNREFNNPSGVAINENGVVFVSDRGNARVQQLGPDGVFLRQDSSVGKNNYPFVSPEYFGYGGAMGLFLTDSGLGEVFSLTSPYDFRAPTSSVNRSSNKEWSNEDVTVNIKSFDGNTGSGIRRITVIDGGKTVIQQSDDDVSYEVSETGVHDISYYAEDKANNVEPAKSLVVKIDKIAPTTKCTKTISGVVLNASDVHSGVRETWYKIDGGISTLYSGPIVTTGRSIKFWSLDNAGNQESSKSMSLK